MNRDLFSTRVLSPEDLEENTAAAALPLTEPAAAAQTLLIFQLGSEHFGLDVGCVERIVPFQAPHPLPHRSRSSGTEIVCVEGQIRLFVDLRALLHVKSSDENVSQHERSLLVLRFDGELTAVAVDRVRAVAAVPQIHFCPLPALNARSQNRCTDSLFRYSDALAAHIDNEQFAAALRECAS